MSLKLFQESISHLFSTLREDVDFRFNEIVSLIEQEAFSQAVPLIEESFQEGQFDIRLIMYFFYAHFLEERLQGLCSIFPLISSLCQEHWEKLTPPIKRDQHFQKSLIWFFTRCNKNLEYVEKLHRTGEVSLWKEYANQLSLETLEEITSGAQVLQKLLTERWPDSSFYEKIQSFLVMIKKFYIAERYEESKKSVEEGSASFSDQKSNFTDISQDSFLFSDPLIGLLKKLDAFEALLQGREYTKAFIIYLDIEHCLTNFDPLAYLPKLFTRYFSLLAEHIDLVDAEMEQKESILHKVLQKLYQTDLKTFLKWRA